MKSDKLTICIAPGKIFIFFIDFHFCQTALVSKKVYSSEKEEAPISVNHLKIY